MQKNDSPIGGSSRKRLTQAFVEALTAFASASGFPALPREAYSVEEAAYVCGLGKATVYLLLESRVLRAKVLNLGEANRRTGRTLILRDDLKSYLASLPDYVPSRERQQS